MFMTWMFCFVEDNKIISGIEKTITETDWKMFNIVPIARGCRLGDNLLSSSTLYMFGLFTGLSPTSTNFHKTFKLSYFFYLVKYHVRYNY
jgi:hypothetical protein